MKDIPIVQFSLWITNAIVMHMLLLFFGSQDAQLTLALTRTGAVVPTISKGDTAGLWTAWISLVYLPSSTTSLASQVDSITLLTRSEKEEED